LVHDPHASFVLVWISGKDRALLLPRLSCATGLVDLAGGWVERSIGQPSSASPTGIGGFMVSNAATGAAG
jgi:hypothetical protein